MVYVIQLFLRMLSGARDDEPADDGGG